MMRMSNKFTNILNVCVKFKIFEYFLELNGTLLNLKICCKQINLIMNDLFVIRATHKWSTLIGKSKIKKLDLSRQKLINKLIYDRDQPLTVDVLPKNLTHLTFGYFFDQPLIVSILPKNLTQLTFNSNGDFNQPITIGVLPPNITHLTFGFNFNHQLAVGVLPKKLTHLAFGTAFNQQLTIGVLPKKLTHLAFGKQFNQQLMSGVLHSKLNKLIIKNRKLINDETEMKRCNIEEIE